jgi:hypothetical protein
VSSPLGTTAVRAQPLRFALILDGVPCGLLSSARGGTATADVIADAGKQGFVPKHLGPARYEPITISFGLSFAPVVFEWIVASWRGKRLRKSGVIQSLGLNQQVVSELAFESATIQRTDLPGLDAASKDHCAISITLAPRKTVRSKGTGQAKVPVSKTKAWLASNFRVEIDGLDCSRVAKVSALEMHGGSPVDFPSVDLALSPTHAETWLAWHEDFVVNGHNDASQERAGALVYLAPDAKTELGRLHLHNVGIFRIAPEPRQPDLPVPTAANRLFASLYCERMLLEVPA